MLPFPSQLPLGLLGETLTSLILRYVHKFVFLRVRQRPASPLPVPVLFHPEGLLLLEAWQTWPSREALMISLLWHCRAMGMSASSTKAAHDAFHLLVHGIVARQHSQVFISFTQAGVADLQFSGRVRVALTNIASKVPVVGSVQVRLPLPLANI